MNKLHDLKTRNIQPEIYVRDDPDNEATYRELNQLSLQYKKIPHLHSKLYLNERYGIVTSMNLLLSSEINSLEIGYVTENRTEYDELIRYHNRYIHFGDPVQYETNAAEPVADLKEIALSIREDLISTGKNAWPWFAENKLHISTGMNNYIFSIRNGQMNITARVRIVPGIKQKSIQPFSLIAKKVEDLTAMQVKVHPVSNPDILQLSAQSLHNFKSTGINRILKTDVPYMLESVRSFIDTLENLVD